MTFIFIVFSILGFMMGTPSATEYTVDSMMPKLDTTYFATFSWLLLAVAGAEIGGTYLHELENPKKNYTKGIFVATGFIAGAYILGSVALGFLISPEGLVDAGLKNAEYVVYKTLAENWGLNGGIAIRLYSTILLISSVAAYILWIESPIRAMFGEVPSGTFPEFLTKKDDKGTLHNALWTQCAIVSVLTVIPIFGIDSVESLCVLITDLTSLALVIPYIVLAVAYYKFRKDGKEAPITLIKSKSVALFVAIMILVISILAFIGAGIDYVIGIEDAGELVKQLLMTYGGPILFILLGFVIKNLSQKKYQKTISESK